MKSSSRVAQGGKALKSGKRNLLAAFGDAEELEAQPKRVLDEKQVRTADQLWFCFVGGPPART